MKKAKLFYFNSLYNFDIINIVESHLKKEINDHTITLNGYNIVRSDTKSAHTAGILILIKNHLPYEIINNYQLTELKSNILSIKVNFNFQIINIVSIYRSPNSKLRVFLNILDEVSWNLTKNNLPLMILGDININFMEDNLNQRNLLELINKYNLHQKVKQFTHRTKSRKTIIDLIAVDQLVNATSINLYNLLISDHVPQLLTIFNDTKNIYKTNKKKILKLNMQLVKEELEKLDVHDFIRTSINDKWTMLYLKLKEIEIKSKTTKYIRVDKGTGCAIPVCVSKLIDKVNHLYHADWTNAMIHNQFIKERNKLDLIMIPIIKNSLYFTTKNVNS